MRMSGTGVALIAALVIAAPLSAQQPAPPAKMGPPAAGMMKMDMQMMGEHMGGMPGMQHPAPGQPMRGMMHPDSGHAPMPGMARPDSAARPRR